MKNIFLVEPEDLIEQSNSTETNLSNEDLKSVIKLEERHEKDLVDKPSKWEDEESDIIKNNPNQKSCGNSIDEKFRNVQDIYEEEDEEEEEEEEAELRVIELYDYTKTHDENFKDNSNPKYILFKVDKLKSMSVSEGIFNHIPSPQSKVLVDFDKVDEYSTLECYPVDYDTIFGLRFLTFIKYNSNFFQCDERIMFEAFLIKFKAFGHKPFFWSKETIFKEVGIKKDRANKIIKRFEELGIISTEVKKSVIANRPQQITYFNIKADKIFDLIPQMFEGRDEIQIVERDLEKYLGPIYKKKQ